MRIFAGIWYGNGCQCLKKNRMVQTSENNKRIAKNTLFLYFRMLLTMLVTLFTSRVVLDKLGITDYGIYNVVGGIVTMLGFLTGSMANAVQRFLSFEIGRGNAKRVNHIFNLSLMAHICIAILVLIVMEFAGVWYLNTYMNIPVERLNAANWVLQCSIFATIFSIIQVPYNAIIIAKEQMGIYAYISIFEVLLKLGIVYLLSIGHFDKLKLYSVLMMLITIGILLLYTIYCVKKYNEAKFKIVKDSKTLKDIIGFAGWNMFGEIAWVFTGQGVNLILNLFFGPAVNAARGLAEQVNGAVSRFVGNFQVAVNPQLVKTYATNQLEDMKKLLYRSTRFSYYLMWILSLPLILNMDFILHIWLKEVPEYTTEFCQLVLICTLVATVSNLLSQVARAYGKIRSYQICVSAFLFLNFPLSYLALKLGASPLVTMLINILIQAILIFVRLLFARMMIGVSILDFSRKVLLPLGKVTLVSSIFPILCLIEMPVGWKAFVVVCLVSLIGSTISVWLMGISKAEQDFIKSLAIKAYGKLKRK